MTYYAGSLSLVTALFGILLLATTYENNGGKMFPLPKQESFVLVLAYIILAFISYDPEYAVFFTAISTLGFAIPLAITYACFTGNDQSLIQTTFPPILIYPLLIGLWVDFLSRWFEYAANVF